MTTQRDAHLQTVRAIREDLLAALDGMDYCLDWKPDADSWSAREVVYHLVDTPMGGLHTLIAGVLDGSIVEFDVTPDYTNVTPERLGFDIGRVRGDLAAVLDGLEKAVVDADDATLAGRTALAHLTAWGEDQERTPEMLLTGLFARHWREHLGQLRELRETLGM